MAEKGKPCQGPRGKGRDLGKLKGQDFRIVRYDDGVTIHEPTRLVKYPKAPKKTSGE